MGLTPQVFVLVLAASVALPLGDTDPALARLFTPLAVPPGTYVVYRSAETIETLTSRLRALDPSPTPGAWQATRPEAHGAFGQDGLYDRARLARLFNGKRVTVVRGSLTRQGQRLAYTLVSPYPNVTLSRIVEGTMVIEFRVPPYALPHSGTSALSTGTPALRHLAPGTGTRHQAPGTRHQAPGTYSSFVIRNS